MKQAKRHSGVLLHVSSLPGDFSVGSFGMEARMFVDFLAESGFAFWQILPFCMTDEKNSPYKSPASFGANPLFIDLVELYAEGLVTYEELKEARQKTPYLCEYDRLGKERLELLRRAAMRIHDRTEIIDYVNGSEELRRVAEFLALREVNGGKPFYEWTVTKPDIDTLFFWQFVQYEFYKMWFALKEYANSKGIRIIGDLPIYMSFDSADVWSEPEQFMLDSDGFPSFVAGVPPDYFAKNGQLWGNPLYDYEKMKADGFDWWKRRMSFALRMFDGVRIDHFRGFEAFWAVPREAKSAKEGKWIKGPGKDLINALSDITCDRLIIAEDLGDITDEVRELVEYSAYPGMRVVQFGFMGDDNSLHLPHNYPKNSVAYTGTHDNNTLLGYVWEISADDRERLLSYCGADKNDWDKGCRAVIRTVMASHSDIAIVPMQDLLVFGADTRMNTPGTDSNNWAYRVTKEQLKSVDTDGLFKLNKLYGRTK